MAVFLEKAFHEERIKREFDEPNAAVFFAWQGKELTAYAKLSSKYQPGQLSGQRAMEIERIYVRRPFQGRHIGQQLILHCISHARRLGFDVIWLGVWEHNPKAISFYEREGFERFGMHDFLVGHDIQHDQLMKLDLQP
jgi:ribosomal protein S18 acetylase RimI-like enzyme